MAKDDGEMQQTLLPSLSGCTDAVDWPTRPDEDSLGGRKCYCCVLGAIALVQTAVYGVIFNLFMFLVFKGETNAAAAATVGSVTGTMMISSFLGAFVCDAYMGHLWTSLIFQSLSTLFYVLLGISVTVPNIGRPLLFVSLYMIAISTGAIVPTLIGLGLDQLNSNKEKFAYFHLASSSGSVGHLLSATLIAYLDDKHMWSFGFWTCTTASIIALALLSVGLRWFRHSRPSQNPFLHYLQVLVAAFLKRELTLPENLEILHEFKNVTSVVPGCRTLPHTSTLRFLDKAALLDVQGTANSWHLCTVTEVEEVKSLIWVIPAGVSPLFFVVAISQINTLFQEQAVLMNRHLGKWLEMPPASLNILATVGSILTGLTMAAVRASILGQYVGSSGHSRNRSVTSFKLVGTALLCGIIAMVMSALVESYRLKSALRREILSVMWLVPQTLLLGLGTNLMESGIFDFFISELSYNMHSTGACIVLIFSGAGSYLNSLLVTIITSITTHSGQAGWIADNLDEGHIDYYYWLIACCVALALGFHITYAYMYQRYRYVITNEIRCVDTEEIS
ncbi:hypothetical protein KP509_31G003700 [Ceratopteris richardii]|uniref:Uncharacterized protein n=1 Tax=Ceratopteris richardii TaxID=49495 RepID=A0A8T2QWW8_CERRI|nr:hypothetical protein KP509_31G003700 [Ceratopteris richardii]KAH7287932.1 hypothetical protein KP509_31G003700 [Ceratopteris richardii]